MRTEITRFVKLNRKYKVSRGQGQQYDLLLYCSAKMRPIVSKYGFTTKTSHTTTSQINFSLQKKMITKNLFKMLNVLTHWPIIPDHDREIL